MILVVPLLTVALASCVESGEKQDAVGFPIPNIDQAFISRRDDAELKFERLLDEMNHRLDEKVSPCLNRLKRERLFGNIQWIVSFHERRGSILDIRIIIEPDEIFIGTEDEDYMNHYNCLRLQNCRLDQVVFWVILSLCCMIALQSVLLICIQKRLVTIGTMLFQLENDLRDGFTSDEKGTTLHISKVKRKKIQPSTKRQPEVKQNISFKLTEVLKLKDLTSAEHSSCYKIVQTESQTYAKSAKYLAKTTFRNEFSRPKARHTGTDIIKESIPVTQNVHKNPDLTVIFDNEFSDDNKTTNDIKANHFDEICDVQLLLKRRFSDTQKKKCHEKRNFILEGSDGNCFESPRPTISFTDTGNSEFTSHLSLLSQISKVFKPSHEIGVKNVEDIKAELPDEIVSVMNDSQEPYTESIVRQECNLIHHHRTLSNHWEDIPSTKDPGIFDSDEKVREALGSVMAFGTAFTKLYNGDRNLRFNKENGLIVSTRDPCVEESFADSKWYSNIPKSEYCIIDPPRNTKMTFDEISMTMSKCSKSTLNILIQHLDRHSTEAGNTGTALIKECISGTQNAHKIPDSTAIFDNEFSDDNKATNDIEGNHFAEISDVQLLLKRRCSDIQMERCYEKENFISRGYDGNGFYIPRPTISYIDDNNSEFSPDLSLADKQISKVFNPLHKVQLKNVENIKAGQQDDFESVTNVSQELNTEHIQNGPCMIAGQFMVKKPNESTQFLSQSCTSLKQIGEHLQSEQNTHVKNIIEFTNETDVENLELFTDDFRDVEEESMTTNLEFGDAFFPWDSNQKKNIQVCKSSLSPTVIAYSGTKIGNIQEDEKFEPLNDRIKQRGFSSAISNVKQGENRIQLFGRGGSLGNKYSHGFFYLSWKHFFDRIEFPSDEMTILQKMTRFNQFRIINEGGYLLEKFPLSNLQTFEVQKLKPRLELINHFMNHFEFRPTDTVLQFYPCYPQDFSHGLRQDQMTQDEPLTIYLYCLLRLRNYRGNASLIRLARNGFYHEEELGPCATRCHRCRWVYSKWDFFDDIRTIHRRYSPSCPNFDESEPFATGGSGDIALVDFANPLLWQVLENEGQQMNGTHSAVAAPQTESRLHRNWNIQMEMSSNRSASFTFHQRRQHLQRQLYTQEGDTPTVNKDFSTEELIQLKKEIEGKRRRQTCNVCVDRLMDTVLLPCGHMICVVCAQQIRRCHICRQRIIKREKARFNI